MPTVAIAMGATMPTNEGWICPRCGTVNAPWAWQCSCIGGFGPVTNATDPCMAGVHTWKQVGYHPSKNTSAVCAVEFKCSRCGKRKLVDTPTRMFDNQLTM